MMLKPAQGFGWIAEDFNVDPLFAVAFHQTIHVHLANDLFWQDQRPMLPAGPHNTRFPVNLSPFAILWQEGGIFTVIRQPFDTMMFFKGRRAAHQAIAKFFAENKFMKLVPDNRPLAKVTLFQ
ncbi:MAG: hypothetical protein KC434_12200, partial [Anaerolineales bacterium]|nr:hypothetical protein [Anaerolineales bacterium]